MVSLMIMQLAPFPSSGMEAAPHVRVILTEIMFNPAGDENTDEYIEVYNCGDTAVDLGGWMISDGSGADFLVSAGGGTLLLPRQYAVILDPDYFQGSAAYDTLIPAGALMMTIDNGTFGLRGLSNSSPEEVMLVSAQGDTLSRIRYSPDNGSGYSEEKIIITGQDTPENWGNSAQFMGTPGARNSLSPPQYDLAVTAFTAASPAVVVHQPVFLSVTVTNGGEFPPDSAALNVYLDADRDGSPERAELLGAYAIDTAAVKEYGDSLVFNLSWEPPGTGELRFSAVVAAEPDSNPANDRRDLAVSVLGLKNSIAINEIMYYPLEDTPEWIELYNFGGEAVNMKNWLFSDAQSGMKPVALGRDLLLNPGNYLVLTADSAGTADFYPGSFAVARMTGFPALNNGGDRLTLTDPAGRTADEVSYGASWGKRRGVSLERVSPEMPGAARGNWGLCTDAHGATPGRKNSLQPVAQSAGIAVTTDPDPFSPEDAMHNTCTITVQLPFVRSLVTMKIYDRLGRVIRDVVRGEPKGSVFTAAWDGRNNAGALMPTDIYIIYLEAFSTGAGGSAAHKSTVVLVRRE